MNHELAETDFFRQHLYDDLSEQTREHLDEKVDELVVWEMPRKEAAAAARREFGNVTLIEQGSRKATDRGRYSGMQVDPMEALRYE